MDPRYIPAKLRRAILVEAGHRCAICHSIPVEIHHIVEYEKVKKHTFDNLIALCPNCHSRCHNGGIDNKSIKQYKENLTILNSRYSDTEKRILKLFSEQQYSNSVKLPGGMFCL